ncbi:deoxyribodipyrimidine photo-lyase [Methylococcus sp. EFPC2]|uniref:cryptochrome/photolyase family protein n=1 Tax=Methylococcus sp. EFPC2 TaxID=2812648 RepID=UPI001967281C|nr:deoxyribodipyrimidine photo-lyase [Methylococcus sp. EFPC2]QSA96613.1 deoxyribodipyrimidine photo-lyase [Methylococcus sp. EFPC2]
MVTSLLWFRRDLRLADNPALCAAVEAGPVIPVYIHDPEAGGDWPEGSASRWWLHHSLAALDGSVRALGSRLIVRRGPPLTVLRELLAATGARRACWNRRYEPAAIACDGELKRELRADGCIVHTYNAALLYEPWQITHGRDRPYQVFTPFWKALQARGLSQTLLTAPAALPSVPENLASLSLEELELLPRVAWDDGLREHWRPGEEAALNRLASFLDSALTDYHDARDRPDLDGVSRLSPHLHFGEIGPRQIIQALSARGAIGAGADSYLRELAWREFAHHLLYHFPQTASESLDPRFHSFPWAAPEPALLAAWQRGRTGIPMVDAGMRELWHTGWMHNRVRMIVASFLTKNLRIHWLEGARWFWDTLVDADLANNTLGWQWTAGCGADAAPYFRIFNPVLQGRRFDPEGNYVRRWVPELAHLPAAYIHHPWEAPAGILNAAGVRLGVSYPLPVVDLKHSREEALAAYSSIKSTG